MELKTPLHVADQGFGLSYFWIEDADGNMVADNGEDGKCQPIMSRDTARRFVACVNACAGISPTDLELAASVSGTQTNPYSASHPRLSARIEAAKIPQHFRNVKQQRDALLAALKFALEGMRVINNDLCGSGNSFDLEIEEAEKAIAAVEGQTS